MSKILCETCTRFIRYDPYELSLKVSTEKCPHACSQAAIRKYAINQKIDAVARMQPHPMPPIPLIQATH